MLKAVAVTTELVPTGFQSWLWNTGGSSILSLCQVQALFSCKYLAQV